MHQTFSGRAWALALALLFIPSAASAQLSGVRLEPAFQEVVLAPGQSVADIPLVVTNILPEPISLRLSVIDFGTLDESGGVAFIGSGRDELEKRYALSEWMRLEKDVLTLEPGQSATVRAVIENKDSLSPGGHYGAVLFQNEGDASAPDVSGNVAVNQFIASLVFLKKEGGERYALGLESHQWERDWLRLPAAVRLRFHNSGNVHVVPRGLVSIRDVFGRETYRGIINEDSTLIYPESFRIYPTRLRPVETAWLPGPYRVVISFRYDGKPDFETREETLYFFPADGILALLVLIATGVTGYAVFLRRASGGRREDRAPRA